MNFPVWHSTFFMYVNFPIFLFPPFGVEQSLGLMTHFLHRNSVAAAILMTKQRATRSLLMINRQLQSVYTK